MDHHTGRPPMEKSEEAKPEQLDMARSQGEEYVQALHHMSQKEADDGGEQRAGDYVITYAIEKAEGMYQLRNGELAWEKPVDENIHIEISVRDGADHRFIPGLEVYVTVLTADGEEVGRHRQPFLWHPWLYHYGRNWKVPGDGSYTLHVEIEAPDFPRHDPKNGRRYASHAETRFEEVRMKTGQK